MTRWPLLLPPPAVSTSPLCSRRSSSSIIVKSPSHHSSPSSCCRAVHRRSAVHGRSAAPSITSPLCSRSIAAALALSLAVEEPSRAIPRRRGAVAPSIAIEERSCRNSPSRSRRPCRLMTPATRLAPPSLSSGWLSRCLSSHRRLPSAGVLHCGHRLSCLSSVRLVVPSPRFSRRHLPSASCHAHLRPLVRLVKASPLLTLPPPICGIIKSSQWSGLMLV